MIKPKHILYTCTLHVYLMYTNRNIFCLYFQAPERFILLLLDNSGQYRGISNKISYKTFLISWCSIYIIYSIFCLATSDKSVQPLLMGGRCTAIQDGGREMRHILLCTWFSRMLDIHSGYFYPNILQEKVVDSRLNSPETRRNYLLTIHYKLAGCWCVFHFDISTSRC